MEAKLEHRLHDMETNKKNYRFETPVVKKESKENGVHSEPADISSQKASSSLGSRKVIWGVSVGRAAD